LRLFSFGGYGLALAALALVVFGAIECPPSKFILILKKNISGSEFFTHSIHVCRLCDVRWNSKGGKFHLKIFSIFCFTSTVAVEAASVHSDKQCEVVEAGKRARRSADSGGSAAAPEAGSGEIGIRADSRAEWISRRRGRVRIAGF